MIIIIITTDLHLDMLSSSPSVAVGRLPPVQIS